MPIYIAYLIVILVWSTTPLAIKWSNDSLAPIAAVSLRMVLACACGLLIMAVWRKAGRLQQKHWRSYALASVSIFPCMPLVYYSAQSISSGLISVLFGLMPFVSAIFAYYLLGENILSWRRVMAQLLALAGLVLISLSQLRLDDSAFYGVMLSVISTCIYSWCSVRLKKMGQTMPVAAFEQTIGALLFALPGLLICWYLAEGSFAVDLSQRSGLSVVYLALIGSLVGFVVFFLVLQQLSVSLISIIPVITPMLAMWLGSVLAGEELTLTTLMGAAMIIVGLILYEGIPGMLWRRFRSWRKKSDQLAFGE